MSAMSSRKGSALLIVLGMLAFMVIHVDQFRRFLTQLYHDFLDTFGSAYHGEHAAVVVAVGLCVQKRNAGLALSHCHQFIESFFVLFFGNAEVRNTFY